MARPDGSRESGIHICAMICVCHPSNTGDVEEPCWLRGLRNARISHIEAESAHGQARVIFEMPLVVVNTSISLPVRAFPEWIGARDQPESVER